MATGTYDREVTAQSDWVARLEAALASVEAHQPSSTAIVGRLLGALAVRTMGRRTTTGFLWTALCLLVPAWYDLHLLSRHKMCGAKCPIEPPPMDTLYWNGIQVDPLQASDVDGSSADLSYGPSDLLGRSLARPPEGQDTASWAEVVLSGSRVPLVEWKKSAVRRAMESSEVALLKLKFPAQFQQQRLVEA